MSLIQEALKRKQEETGQPAPPVEPPPVTLTPPPAPEQQPEPVVAKAPHPLIVTSVVVMITGLLIAIGALSLYLIQARPFFRSPETDNAVQADELASVEPDTEPVATEPQYTVVVPPPPPQPVAPSQPPAAAVEAVNAEPAQAAPAAVAPAPAPEPQPAPVLTVKLTQPWPQLNLSGIASSGNQRIAIINGKMLSAGRSTGEVLVREVRETEVVLEFRGETRILHADE